MGRRFEVTWDGELAGTPRQVWDAITVHSAGYLWQIDYEPRLGGTERGLTGHGGVVSAWHPYEHFATTAEGNHLDYRLEARGEHTYLYYTHQSEADEDDFDRQYDSCVQHTRLYQHSLGQYVQHFAGRDAVCVTIDAPQTPNAYTRLRNALGIPANAQAGDLVTLTPTGLAPISGVIDYQAGSFLGIRTADTLYRVYGRDTWGWPVGVSVHRFDTTTATDLQQTWTDYLDNTLAKETVA